MSCNKDMKKLRENLTLDFNQRPSSAKKLKSSALIDRSLSRASNMARTCQLTTPDVDKLALTTPEVAELLAHNNSISLQTFTRNCDSEEEKPSKQALELWTNTVQNKNSPIKVKKIANNTAPLPDAKPMQPINMQDQEMAKLERKRLRNRIAASKCRQRKLERINKLQKKVDNLKCRNDELSKCINILNDVNNKLLTQLTNHQDFGCSDLKIML